MMNKYFLLLVIASAPAFAWDSDNEKQGYKSRFGSEYEYDLSKPTDQIRYEVDVGAQMRDEMDVDPRREIEQDMGQYGGGKINR